MSEDNFHTGNKNNLAGQEDDQITTMAELLAQQEQEELFRVVQPGEIVKGVVASKRPGEILIDIGAKSEGVVEQRDLDKLSPEELAEIHVGDVVPAYVLSAEGDEEGYHINLSLSQARAEKDWDEAERLFESEEMIETTVIGNNKGGLIVNFGQVRGFVPGSQLMSGQYGGASRAERWNQLTGETLKLKIIEVDRDRNRLILSERAAAQEARKDKVKLLAELTEGEVQKGRVTSLADFGAFVDIGGIDGLVHLSELAWTRVSHPREVLKVGDEIDVYILNVDLEQQRVALSIKRLQPEPWSRVFDYYQIDQIVEAVITKLTKFGAFARIDDRIEGLIHISEISDRNITHPQEVLSEGQEVQVRIIHIDPERRRMGLSIKQVEGFEEWLHYKETKQSETKTSEPEGAGQPSADVVEEKTEEQEEEKTVEEA